MKIDSVRKILKNSSCDALLISSVPNIIYLTGYSGFSKDEREVFLIVTKNINYIITDGRYSEAVKNIKGFTLVEISPTFSFEQAFKHLVSMHHVKHLGIEENDITVQEHKKLQKHLNDIYHLSESLNNIRIIKDLREIHWIKKACELGDNVFKHILQKITKDITEKELAFEIEYFIKSRGADISFPPIVAFGENSAIPHHQTSERELKQDEIVLLDFGVKLNNYCSDMTRTLFFGKASDKFVSMFQTVYEAQKKAIELLYHKLVYDTTVQAKNIDKVARNYILSKGYSSIPHSLGHGIGIEVHETPFLSPKSKSELKPGMVFSIEPGIYLPAGRQGEPGFGGVRIEDIVVLEKSGPRLLTHSPKHLIELKI